MVNVKKGDFVALDFTAKVVDGEVFDTTKEADAKEAGLQSPNGKYEPLVIVVGEHQIIPGLDRDVVDKEVGKEYTLTFSDEDAFGKKKAELIQMVPAKLFSKENMKPYVGLQINVDGKVGTVRSVSGGRVMVDFNHPLSSKEVEYVFTVTKIVDDLKEKVQTFAAMLQLPSKNIKVEGEKAIITMPSELPEQYTTLLSKDMSRVTGVKEVEFTVEKNEKGKNTDTKPNTPDNKTQG